MISIPKNKEHDMSVVLQRVRSNLDYIKKRLGNMSKTEFIREWHRIDDSYFMASHAVYQVADLFSDKMKKGPVHEEWTGEIGKRKIAAICRLRNRLAHNFVPSHLKEGDKTPTPQDLWNLMISPAANDALRGATMKILKKWTEGELQENQENWKKEEALRNWIRVGNLGRVQESLKQGVSPIAPDLDGNAPLHLAVGAGVADNLGEWIHTSNDDRAHIVKELLKAGARVDARNAKGQTPLFTALETIREESRAIKAMLALPEHIKEETLDWYKERSAQRFQRFLKTLVAAGASPDARSKTGDTPLFFAVAQHDTEMVGLLLRHDADPNAQTSVRDGSMSVLGHIPFLADMLDDEAASEVADDSPLHQAVIGNAPDIVSILVDHGADRNLQDMMHRTPLHWSAEKDSDEITYMLLQKGAELDVQDREGDTPLHIASRRGHKDIVVALIAAGSSPLVLNSEGKTPRACLQDFRSWSQTRELSRILKKAENP